MAANFTPTAVQARVLLAALAHPAHLLGDDVKVVTVRAMQRCGWTKQDSPRQLSDAGVLAAVDLANKPRSMREASSPITLAEVTDEMLAQVRRDADASWIPQTVWPSRYFGKDAMGTSCLLTSSAMGSTVPSDAAADTLPLLTVLPARYFAGYGLAEAMA